MFLLVKPYVFFVLYNVELLIEPLVNELNQDAAALDDPLFGSNHEFEFKQLLFIKGSNSG